MEVNLTLEVSRISKTTTEERGVAEAGNEYLALLTTGPAPVNRREPAGMRKSHSWSPKGSFKLFSILAKILTDEKTSLNSSKSCLRKSFLLFQADRMKQGGDLGPHQV